jgi:hypothetical protein
MIPPAADVAGGGVIDGFGLGGNYDFLLDLKCGGFDFVCFGVKSGE